MDFMKRMLESPFGLAVFKGDSDGSATSTSITNEPPELLKPAVEKLVRDATGAVNQVSTVPFQGQLAARPTSEQLVGQQQQLATALAFLGQGSPLINLGQQQVSGQFLNPASNPFLQASIQAGIQPVQERFQEQIIPGIRNRGIQEGAFGGAREQLQLGQAAEGFSEEALNIASRIAFENFARERAIQQGSGSLVAQGLGLELTPGQILSEIGGQRQGFQQNILDENRQQFAQNQAAPFAGLAQFASLLGIPNFGNQQQQQQGGQGSTFGNVLQGGAGGAASGAALSTLLPFTGPQGAIAGGILGALGGLF
jgi:hypothetical protein